MIEGLRVFPAYQDARGKRLVMATCEECKRTVSTDTRQAMGCGWEAPIDGARPWSPASWAERGIATSTCPGYTTTLPIVGEIIDAYPQWEQGTLTDYLDGTAPTPIALTCLTMLRAGIREHEAAPLREASQKRAGG